MKAPIIKYNDKLLNRLSWFMKIGGITLWPWIILRESYLHFNNKERHDKVVRHESIHIKQQEELLVIFFYILYVLNFILNIVLIVNIMSPYKNICFEREARANENNINYLNERKAWAWIKYII